MKMTPVFFRERVFDFLRGNLFPPERFSHGIFGHVRLKQFPPVISSDKPSAKNPFEKMPDLAPKSLARSVLFPGAMWTAPRLKAVKPVCDEQRNRQYRRRRKNGSVVPEKNQRPEGGNKHEALPNDENGAPKRFGFRLSHWSFKKGH